MRWEEVREWEEWGRTRPLELSEWMSDATQQQRQIKILKLLLIYQINNCIISEF